MFQKFFQSFNCPFLQVFLVLSIMCIMTLSSHAEPLSESKSEICIIPKPVSVKVYEGEFLFNHETVILVIGDAGDGAELFLGRVRKATQFPLIVHEFKVGMKVENAVVFRIDESDATLGDEGYSLHVTPERIDITAKTEAGIFYACQTLRQLLPHEIELRVQSPGVSWIIPCVEIQDKPRFSWRGYMLDSARHFQDKEYIKRIIDLISLYKMNRLHWHLVDDQGWRLEIKAYPKLTRVGAFRPNINARLNYMPTDSVESLDSTESTESGERYGGFYSQNDIREIVAYAEARHVVVVPEIEMPGHCLSALMAYPELSCTGEIPTELGNTWIYKDVYCAGNEKTFAFIEGVLFEVMTLFPSPWIHIGGDECPKDRWQACPKCQQRIKEEGLATADDLHSYFIRRVEAFVRDKGRRLIGWDDNFEAGVPSSTIIQPYRKIEYGIEAAQKGYDVIMSPHSHCYFDYDYSATSASKAYSLEPVGVELTPEQASHILGVECCQWLGNVSRRYYESHGIMMPTHEIEYHTFPRLLATAEVGWSPKEIRETDDFIKRLKAHGLRLDALEVNFFRAPSIWQNTRVSKTFKDIWADPELEKRISDGIERYRKSDVSVYLFDTNAKPITNVEVSIEQTSHDFLFGSNIFVLGQLATPEANAQYEAAFRKILNSATIPFYWLWLEPVQGELRYEEGSRRIWRRPPPDRVLAWCKHYDIVPKGHPLLWHAHNPDWLPEDPEALKELFLKRFREIATRYGHEIALWDGVNEPIDCVKDFPLYDEERSYVEWAFREQRTLFPASAQLFINEMPHVCHEYNGEDPTQTRYYKHIKGLVERGVPFDGIGFQFHIMSDQAVAEILGGHTYSPRQLLQVYDLYDRFELPMYITEITMPTPGSETEGEELQKEMVRNYYRLWFSVPRMKGITWWNLGDGTAIEHETKFNGGLLRKNLDPKPSYLELERLINHEWSMRETLRTDENGHLSLRCFHGKYSLRVDTGEIIRQREIHVKEDSDNTFKIAIW